MGIATAEDRTPDALELRKKLAAQYGDVWDTDEVQRVFEVKGFWMPVALVVRRSDGEKGTLAFHRHPRFYYDFQEGGW